MKNSDIDKRCFKAEFFYCIELEAQKFYKIMGPWILLFDINLNFIPLAVPDKRGS